MDRLNSDASEALRRLRVAVSEGDLVRLAEAYDLQLLVLFGSASRDEGLPHDLDLGYLAGSGIDHWRLLSEVYDLVGTDLVDLSTANVVLRSEVLAGIPLFEAVDGTFAQEQMDAIVRRLDTRWLRLLSLETMAAGGRSGRG